MFSRASMTQVQNRLMTYDHVNQAVESTRNYMYMWLCTVRLATTSDIPPGLSETMPPFCAAIVVVNRVMTVSDP